MDPKPGAVVAGKYRIGDLLGSGAMGNVYAGVHVDIGRRVAIKLMNHAFADAPDVRARFRREARAASAVESDYIVQIFDAGHDDTYGSYLVSELLVGEDLAARIARTGPLDVSTAVTIGYQIARGLAKAHAAGVIHRDLKPSNLFLTVRDDGALLAKILDFGVAKLLSDPSDPPSASSASQSPCLTVTGSVVGTPQYMSPEQVDGMVLDGRTDLWSLAAVVYEALSGKPAFPSRPSFVEVLASILREPIAALDFVAPQVPHQVALVVHAGLERDRSRRIPDATAFAERLAQACPEVIFPRTGPLHAFCDHDEDIPVSIVEVPFWGHASTAPSSDHAATEEHAPVRGPESRSFR